MIYLLTYYTHCHTQELLSLWLFRNNCNYFVTEPTCAEKSTQTEPADFNKLTNGQTCLDEKQNSTDKTEEQNKHNNIEKLCNNFDKNNIHIANEKADTL